MHNLGLTPEQITYYNHITNKDLNDMESPYLVTRAYNMCDESSFNIAEGLWVDLPGKLVERWMNEIGTEGEGVYVILQFDNEGLSDFCILK